MPFGYWRLSIDYFPGQLVCFFRAPPRIVRNAIQELANPSSSMSPRVMTRGSGTPGLLQSPGLVSDAVQRLALVAQDRPSALLHKSGQDANNILRIMTNLLTFPGYRQRRGISQQSRPAEDSTAYQLLSTRLSKVVIHDASNIIGVNESVAREYVVDLPGGPAEVCRRNAAVAAQHGHYIHERLFMVLEALCRKAASQSVPSKKPGGSSPRLFKAM